MSTDTRPKRCLFSVFEHSSFSSPQDLWESSYPVILSSPLPFFLPERDIYLQYCQIMSSFFDEARAAWRALGEEQHSRAWQLSK